MRIAVLLTGFYRPYCDYETNIKSLFDEIPNVEIDLFFTTWHDPLLTSLKHENYKVVDIESQSIYVNDIYNHSEYISFVNRYKNETPLYKKWSLCGESPAKYNTPFIYYKLNRGLNIIKKYSLYNNIKYDLILKTRTDISMQGNFSENYINDMHDDGLYVKQITYNNITDFKGCQEYCEYTNNWIDDTFYFFKFNTLDNIKDVYQHYYNISVENNTWITHVILDKYFKKNNIKIYDHNFNVFVIRKDSWYQPHFYLY